MARIAPALIVLALSVLAGCEGDDDPSPGETDRGTTAGNGPRRSTRPLTFSQLETLPLGTPRRTVVERIGPAEGSDFSLKPGGVVAVCVRYRSVNETTERPDPNVDFRLCYDRAGKLSVKSTAPRE